MDDADSAQVLLRGLAPEHFSSADERARLVLTEAMTRYRLSDYSILSDSLLTEAIEHFESHGDKRRLMQGLFLRADQRYQRTDYAEAMNDALRANEIAEKYATDEWEARTSEQIADLFAVTQNYQEALPYIDNAIEHYHAAGKERNVRFALCDKADALESLNKAGECIKILDSLLVIVNQGPLDKQLIAYCYKSIFPALYRQNKLDRLLVILKEYEKISAFSSTDCSYMAETLVRVGKPIDAEPYLRRARLLAIDRIDKYNEYRALMYYYRAKGNNSTANDYADSLRSTVMSEVNDILRQTPLSIQRNVYNAKYKEERERYNRSVIISFIIASLLIITIISLILFYSFKMRLRRKDIENKMEDIHSLSLQLANALNKPDTNEQLHKYIHTLFHSQWQTMNTLCNRYFDDSDSEISKTLIFSDFKKILSQMTSKKYLREMEEAVNTYLDNILNRIKEEYPKIKDDEIKFLTLIFSGFSAKTICLFMNISLSNFYTKRNRLLKRIAQNVSAELGETIKTYI